MRGGDVIRVARHAVADDLGIDFRAAGAGIPSIRVEDPADVRTTLEKGLADPGPVLMEFVTDPNALSIPPAITGEQVRGFARSATKQILGGGVGKMVDLARSNLRNIPRP